LFKRLAILSKSKKISKLLKAYSSNVDSIRRVNLLDLIFIQATHAVFMHPCYLLQISVH